ncbi:leucine-rich repeat domain-containing protein [Hugenholtzia roseola]|uniref:leucine-rich repeat domain-containing protein n=1 Tax=Hugenholtzia roseola TaxID=1002 RepID=UPI0003F7CFA0|nr:leucine-rich repeat domain-containing protein [Hugenholtzia roseola]
MSNQKAVEILREKIATLQEAWAISADAAQKFAYQKQIEQAQAELANLVAKSNAQTEAISPTQNKKPSFFKINKIYFFIALLPILLGGTFLFFKHFSLQKKEKTTATSSTAANTTTNTNPTKTTENALETISENVPEDVPENILEGTTENPPLPLSDADLAREPLFYRLPDKVEKQTRLYRLHLAAEDFAGLISKDKEKIAFFSEKIKNLKHLQSLSFAETLPLNNREWELFFESLSTLPFLASLDLSHQKLEKVPASLFLCQNLKTLNLSDNSLAYLPAEIGNLKKLQFLYLNQNQLTELPQSLATLPHLKTLSLLENAPLSGAAIQTLTKIAALKTLHFEIKNGQLLQFALLRLQNLPQLSQIEIDLTALDFKSFPPALQKLQNLTALHLRLTASSQTGDIFQKLATLPKLKRLHLRLQGSPYLSQEILKVKQIESLYLTHEQYLDPADLAEKVSQLPNLKHLILTQKKEISHFPAQWKRLAKIQVEQRKLVESSF